MRSEHKKSLARKILLGIILLSAANAGVHAEDHFVDFYNWGFDPEEIDIMYGDTVYFFNKVPGTVIQIGHLSGPCADWETDPIPWNYFAPVVFDCAPGTEIIRENAVFFYTGTINILGTPTPEPTPVPAMNPPARISVLLLMGLLLSGGLTRRALKSLRNA